MNPLQAPRGTRDILPDQQAYWRFATDIAEAVARSYGYQAITTPTYESLALFERGIGAGTDVMDKELFLVRGIRQEEGSDQYALRPEGTAGIVRAYIEHGMSRWPQPVQLFSSVRNFRYDRPQKGRFREHVQFDIELFGPTHPSYDAQTIIIIWQILQTLGIQGVRCQLNSLGTSEERSAYEAALTAYLQPFSSQLSSDSQARLSTNPLRILDSKDAADQALLDGAPTLADHLGEASTAHITSVMAYLDAAGVAYVRDLRLVRGLDYYSHTAFEFVLENASGQQGSLGGGGRYDGLVPQLGGDATGAVGAGLGFDRVVDALIDQAIEIPSHYTTGADVGIIAETSSDTTIARCLQIMQAATSAGITCCFDGARESVNSQQKLANRRGCHRLLSISETSYTLSKMNGDAAETFTFSITTEELIRHLTIALARPQ